MFLDDEENKGTILYIEDDPNNRMLVRRILMAEGYTVEEAFNATMAFEKLNTLMPDLILMDINMPEMDGYTLTAQIRQNSKFNSVPIIALTANVMKGDRERSLEAGCDGFIPKPIDIDALPLQVQRFLRKR
jgi:two-component system cell cycle response regulator DivK